MSNWPKKSNSPHSKKTCIEKRNDLTAVDGLESPKQFFDNEVSRERLSLVLSGVRASRDSSILNPTGMKDDKGKEEQGLCGHSWPNFVNASDVIVTKPLLEYFWLQAVPSAIYFSLYRHSRLGYRMHANRRVYPLLNTRSGKETCGTKNIHRRKSATVRKRTQWCTPVYEYESKHNRDVSIYAPRGSPMYRDIEERHNNAL